MGNSLIDDKSVAHDAFVWEEEFPEVFEQGGFDVVIGNPPYVQLQSIKEVSNQLEKQNYKTFEKTGDLYVLFYELGNELLKEHGLLGYITSNKWMRARYGKQLRAYLSKESNPKFLIDLGSGIFESATVDSNILISEKIQVQGCNLVAIDLSKEKDFLGFESYISNSISMPECSEDIWIISNPLEQIIKNKIENIGTPLKDFNINIYRGIQTGNNDVFIIDENRKKLLLEEDANSIDLIRPILQGKDIKRYISEFNKQYLIYVNDETEINNYPAIYNYLLAHKETLEKKKEVRENKMLWYTLYRPAKRHINEFNNEKIFYNQIGNTIEFYLDKENFYSNDKLYFITAEELNLQSLIALLNSKTLQYYFSIIFNFGGGKGKEVFQYIPIANLKTESEISLNQKADKMLTLNKTLQTKKQTFLKRVTDNLSLDKPSKKLEAFYEHDFKTFLGELKKKKVTLTLKNQDEWEEYFNDYQKELLALKADIDATDKQIDAMVYELYGLSEEEIAVVEGRV